MIEEAWVAAKTFEPRLEALGGAALASAALPEQFTQWIARAKPGDRMVYAEARWLPKASCAPVLALVRASYDDGEILLVQERHPELAGRFRYLAIRRLRRQRPAPQVRFVPRGVPA